MKRNLKIASALMALALLSIATSSSYALTVKQNDLLMSELLIKAGVEPQGHREYQEALIICRIMKDGAEGEPVCDIANKTSEKPSVNFFDGKLAKELSNLLSSYGIEPVGHRDYQSATVICNIPKDGTSGEPQCFATKETE